MAIGWGVAQAPPASAAAPRVLVDRVVAAVDGDIITLQDLTALAHRAQSEQLSKVLDDEIDERLLSRQMVRMRDQLGIKDQDVDTAIQEVRASNQLSEAQLTAALAQEGLSMAGYRAKLRAQMERARAVQLRMQGRPEPGAEAVRQRCLTASAQARGDTRMCAAHILVPLAPEAHGAARQRVWQRARRLAQQLADGAAWDAVAHAAQQAGDGTLVAELGCFGRGEMVEAFEDAAFGLAPGQSSDVVETPVGLHIIHLLRREEGPRLGCNDAQDLEPHRQAMIQEDMQRQLMQWISELRRQASIEKRL